MSASKQKKNRADQTNDSLNRKAAAAAEQAKKDKVYRRKVIITLVCIVVVVAAALLINSNLFYTRTTAVQVGDTKFSPAEVDFFYKSAYNSIYEYYYNTLGSSVSMILDSSQPLNEQQFSDEQTWADYIFERAKEEMQQVTVYYNAAMQDGYTLTDEDTETVNSNVEQMRSYATSNSFPNLDSFLAAYYGKGMNEKLFTRLTERSVIADRYAQDLRSSLTYTDAELDAYYQEHADEMDVYRYSIYSISADDQYFDDLAEDDRAAAAHDAAYALTEAGSVEAFREQIKPFAGEDFELQVSTGTPLALDSRYKEWMMDPARKAGDATVLESDSNIFEVVLFVEYDNNDYNTVSMRHVLVKVEADDDGLYTDEAKAEAKEKIEGIYADWQLLGSEEGFAALAEEYSDDTGSNTNGGLYTDIQKDAMVPVVNDFLFAPGRKAGDTEIVYNSGSYTGYHLLYFVGETENNHRLTMAKDAKLTEDFNAMYDAMAANYEVTTGAGVRFANLT